MSDPSQPEHGVVSGAAAHRVVAAEATHHVTPATAVEDVVPEVSDHDVEPVTSLKLITTRWRDRVLQKGCERTGIATVQ